MLLRAHDFLLIGILHRLSVREVLWLRHLRIPINRRLYLWLLISDLHGRHHNLYRQGNDLALAQLVPAIVLNEELEYVIDAD